MLSFSCIYMMSLGSFNISTMQRVRGLHRGMPNGLFVAFAF